jgi:ferric-dicitrate binding protein FerR (iron transport regulator)
MTPDDDHSPVGHLLQRARRRETPPESAREQTYRAVHAAWLQTHRQRVRLRHLSLAAAVLLGVGLASLLWLQGLPRAPANVSAARVESLSGSAVLHGDSGASPVPVPLAPGSLLNNGDVIRSAAGSRLVLRRPGGLIVHLGPDSEIAWVSHDTLHLVHGLLYIDTAGSHGDEAFAVITHAGRIRHVGTRFSVQVDARTVRVMVRDGAVAIGTAQNEHLVPGGHEERISAAGDVADLPLTEDSGPWNWLLDGTPRFVVEARSLHEVVNEMASAAGVALVWPTPADEQQAQHLVLHGPTLAMAPLRALEATLLTTRFTLQQTAAGSDGARRYDVVAR